MLIQSEEFQRMWREIRDLCLKSGYESIKCQVSPFLLEIHKRGETSKKGFSLYLKVEKFIKLQNQLDFILEIWYLMEI